MLSLLCKTFAIVIGIATQMMMLFSLYVIHASKMASPWFATAVILVLWYVITRGVKALYHMQTTRSVASQPIQPRRPAPSMSGSISCGDEQPIRRTPAHNNIVDDAMNSPAMQAWRAQRAARSQ